MGARTRWIRSVKALNDASLADLTVGNLTSSPRSSERGPAYFAKGGLASFSASEWRGLFSLSAQEEERWLGPQARPWWPKGKALLRLVGTHRESVS